MLNIVFSSTKGSKRLFLVSMQLVKEQVAPVFPGWLWTATKQARKQLPFPPRLNSCQYSIKIKKLRSGESTLRSKISRKDLGYERTESSMKKALALLEELRPLTSRLKAGNYHDLMRVLESLNIFLVATLVTVASLQRRETRWGGNLIAPRGDFPNPDPQWAKRTVVLRKGPAHEYDIRFEIRLTEKSEESIVN